MGRTRRVGCRVARCMIVFPIQSIAMELILPMSAKLTCWCFTFYVMDNHHYAHIVATFMQQCFQSRLAKVTGHDVQLSMPAVPVEIDSSLHQACLFAVERCLCAFTNPSTFA